MVFTEHEVKVRKHIEDRCRQHMEYLGATRAIPATFDYRLEHTRTAVGIADSLAALIGVEPGLARIALWLHDIAKVWDNRLNKEQNEERFGDHGARGAIEAREFLLSIGFPEMETASVAAAVGQHVGFFREQPLTDPLAALVWDADKLSKITLAGKLHYLGVQLLFGGERWPSLEHFFTDPKDLQWRRRVRDSLNLPEAQAWADRELAGSEKIIAEIVRTLRGLQ